MSDAGDAGARDAQDDAARVAAGECDVPLATAARLLWQREWWHRAVERGWDRDRVRRIYDSVIRSGHGAGRARDVVVRVTPEVIVLRTMGGAFQTELREDTLACIAAANRVTADLAHVPVPERPWLPSCAELRARGQLGSLGASLGGRGAPDPTAAPPTAAPAATTPARDTSGHHCHARGCPTPCRPEMLMCARHWRLVPPAMQRAVWASYRAGQCDDMNPSEAWHAAADAAIAFVATLDPTGRGGAAAATTTTSGTDRRPWVPRPHVPAAPLGYATRAPLPPTPAQVEKARRAEATAARAARLDAARARQTKLV